MQVGTEFLFWNHGVEVGGAVVVVVGGLEVLVVGRVVEARLVAAHLGQAGNRLRDSVRTWKITLISFVKHGAGCSSEVRAFAHGAMGRRIDPLWGEPIELFLVPASAPRLV